MNSLDKQYQDLLKTILEHGVEKNDRTGTGTKSIFGYTIRHKMSDGFPLLTTKKMAWKTMVTELLWFLRGDTNIKYLVDNDCHIWDGDAYKSFKNSFPIKKSNPPKDYINEAGQLLRQEEFINKIKTDDDFAKEWGELGPIYGAQWRSWTKLEPNVGQSGVNKTYIYQGYNGLHTHYLTQIDQISNLINDLKTNPDSRRLMVNAWNVGELESMVLPPCHYGFQVYTRELSSDERYNLLSESEKKNFIIAMRPMMSPDDKYDEVHYTIDNYYKHIPSRAISLMWNQRSVDTFLGLPFNIASYGLLLQIIAKEVNMVPDQLIGNLGDTHLYLNHIDQAKEQIEREPFELPQVLKKDEYHYLSDMDIPFTEKVMEFKPDWFKLENYQSHPAIKAPLSN